MGGRETRSLRLSRCNAAVYAEPGGFQAQLFRTPRRPPPGDQNFGRQQSAVNLVSSLFSWIWSRARGSFFLEGMAGVFAPRVHYSSLAAFATHTRLHAETAKMTHFSIFSTIYSLSGSYESVPHVSPLLFLQPPAAPPGSNIGLPALRPIHFSSRPTSFMEVR